MWTSNFAGFQPLLDQELSHLPDKYRIPILLCDLPKTAARCQALLF